MAKFSEGGTIEPDEVYSDGSPIWTRILADESKADPDLLQFQSGDLNFWVSGKSGPLPDRAKVVVHPAPHHRKPLLHLVVNRWSYASDEFEKTLRTKNEGNQGNAGIE